MSPPPTPPTCRIFWSQKTRSNNELIAAARDLAAINASYDFRIREDARLRTEITRLEELLRLPSYGEFRSEPARVVRRDFNAWWQRIIVRKGRNHGILAGSPVIYSGGLAGRVVEVHATTSVVELISSPGLRLAAVFDGDDRPVSFQGGINAPLRPAQGVLEFVPLDLFATAASPRDLVTSGLGGVFPPGLAVGRVVQLEPKHRRPFQNRPSQSRRTSGPAHRGHRARAARSLGHKPRR